MDHDFIITDVFTSVPFGGNQLAVLPDARGLSTERMQAVTREFGYSETVFVLPPEDSKHTAKLRIFTPGRELPFAGHPTVGAAITLVEEGIVELEGDGTATIVFEEGVGPVRVSISQRNGESFAELTAAIAPERVDGVASREALAAALSLDPADLDPTRSAEVFSCGVPFAFVPVRDRSVLARIDLDREHFMAEIAPTAGPQVFVFANDPEDPEHDIRARMFAPTLGVDEDPATGAASAALNGYLGSALEDGEHHWTIEQGYEMGRPSQIHITAVVRNEVVVEARVGGHAVRFAKGRVTGD